MGNLKTLIKERMHNSYLEKYLKAPVLNEDKLFILTSILDNTDLPDDKKKNYTVSTMLVQMALDTHDLVPKTNDSEQSNTDKVTKQLSVLAGDYYSGLYYLLLAEIEDLEMVRILATAIKEINEYKMQLYYRHIESFETFITIVKKIETLLYIHVAEYVGETTVSGISARWLLTRKLNEERKSMLHSSTSALFSNWYNQNSSTNTFTMHVAETYVSKEIGSVRNQLNHFPKHLTAVKSHIQETLNEFPNGNRRIVEEG
ncbi:heptaprenyl diphosphate synthase component 1 [Virgibacillus sp. L01]|uniref:heptaprenyl diphosphate synthase component 1 n=1 Tax=Virgibacillus sp. L01 TaxID=3457429 RepID=UPI003FD25DC8